MCSAFNRKVVKINVSSKTKVIYCLFYNKVLLIYDHIKTLHKISEAIQLSCYIAVCFKQNSKVSIWSIEQYLILNSCLDILGHLKDLPQRCCNVMQDNFFKSIFSYNFGLVIDCNLGEGLLFH